MVLISFIRHFFIIKLIRGDRNSFNASDRTNWYKLASFLLWFIELPVKCLDLLGFFYLFDRTRRVFFITRKLSDFERKEAKLVFGDSINWNQIRIRENSAMARMGARSAKKKHIGFVLFQTINFSRELDHDGSPSDMPWLIHELVHTLQFKYIGASYIIEALRAQKNAGYNYCGQEGLSRSEHLENFNLEQQADIARDYYKLLKFNEDVSSYESFIDELRQGKI